MGNQSAKETRSDQTDGQDTKNGKEKDVIILEQKFKELQLKTDEGSTDHVSREVFKDTIDFFNKTESLHPQLEHIGSGCTAFWDGLFVWMTGEKSLVQVTREQFVSGVMALQELTTVSQQQDVYYKIFLGTKSEMDVDGVKEMVAIVCELTLLAAGLTANPSTFTEDTVAGVVKSMMGNENSLSYSDFCYWSGRHCPRLMSSFHSSVMSTLLQLKPLQQQGAGEGSCQAGDMTTLLQGHGLLNGQSLSLLSCSLPVSYCPSITSISSEESRNTFLGQVAAPGGWSLLYNSNDQGLSVNRFQHHVFSYKGPTLMVLLFESQVYCLAVDEEWRQSRSRWGGDDCVLLQLSPQYRVMLSGATMVYLNFEDRTAPRGMKIGKDAKTTMLEIDEGLSKVKHYGIEYDLLRVEVWGCAGSKVLEAQQKQRMWERKDIDRQKNRKLKLEDWKDNPDRQLLEMGGIQTEHAER